MRLIFIAVFLSSILLPIDGIIIFNDQTVISGDVKEIDNKSVSIIPDGLNFPEDILLQSIDSVKIKNGMIPIANGKVIFYYQNGEFLDPQKLRDNQQLNSSPDYEYVEYVLVPNWSLNFYTGHPLPAPLRGESFTSEFDEGNFIYGLSVGSPYGFFAGNFYMNFIAEFAYYNWQQSNNLSGPSFGGPAYQIGISPGFFIGTTSFSATACTGFYSSNVFDSTRADYVSDLTAGAILGGSIDIPLGEIILERYGSVELFKPLNLFIGQFVDLQILNGFRIKEIEEQLSAFEMRITGRTNLIRKADRSDGQNQATYWIDLGVSFGYEFDYGGHPKLPSWIKWPF